MFSIEKHFELDNNSYQNKAKRFLSTTSKPVDSDYYLKKKPFYPFLAFLFTSIDLNLPRQTSKSTVRGNLVLH